MSWCATVALSVVGNTRGSGVAPAASRDDGAGLGFGFGGSVEKRMTWWKKSASPRSHTDGIALEPVYILSCASREHAGG